MKRKTLAFFGVSLVKIIKRVGGSGLILNKNRAIQRCEFLKVTVWQTDFSPTFLLSRRIFCADLSPDFS